MRRPFYDPDADPLALDEATAERLLAGELRPAQAPPGYAEVAALLAATVAAPTPEELAGREAVLAELRAVARARRPAVVPRRAVLARRRAGRQRRRRRVGLAAVAVVGALVSGGAASALTGHLPGPVKDATRSILVTVGAAEPATSSPPGPRPVPAPASTGTPGTGPQGPRPTGGTNPEPGPAAGGSPTPQDKDALCRAYLASQDKQQGKKMEAAAFERLAEAAGGADQIPAYCQGTTPGNAKPKEDKPPPDDRDQGGGGQNQGGPPPPGG